MSEVQNTQEDTFGLPSSREGQRYYFDTYDGDEVIRDDEGLVFGSLVDAKEQAIKALPNMAQDRLPHGGRHFMVEIRDESGSKVYRARLTLVVEDPPEAE